MCNSSFYLVVACSFLAAGCGGSSEPRLKPNERLLTRADLGDKWPFTVDSGVLSCEPYKAVVFHANGQQYGVNGTAKSRGFVAPEPIWREQPPLKYDNVVARLPQPKRREVFDAILACEDNGTKQAEAATSDVRTQLELEKKLQETCKAKVRKAENITEDEATRIANEGVANYWIGKPLRVSVGPVIEAGLKLCQ